MDVATDIKQTADAPAPREFVPSVHQTRFFSWVRDGRGSAVLVAVAGSGKTTSVMRAQKEIPEGKSVRLLAFNAIIAAELNERLADLRKETGRPFQGWTASTFHSLGLSAVRKFLNNIQIGKPDVKKVANLCREFMSEADLDAYGDYVADLVSKAKGEGVGALTPDLPQAWFDLIRHHDLTLPVEGATEARQMPGVKIVEVAVVPGDVVPEMNSSLARVGHVIAEGATAAEAVARAEAARDAIQIRTEKLKS